MVRDGQYIGREARTAAATHGMAWHGTPFLVVLSSTASVETFNNYTFQTRALHVQYTPEINAGAEAHLNKQCTTHDKETAKEGQKVKGISGADGTVDVVR